MLLYAGGAFGLLDSMFSEVLMFGLPYSSCLISRFGAFQILGYWIFDLFEFQSIMRFDVLCFSFSYFQCLFLGFQMLGFVGHVQIDTYMFFFDIFDLCSIYFTVCVPTVVIATYLFVRQQVSPIILGRVKIEKSTLLMYFMRARCILQLFSYCGHCRRRFLLNCVFPLTKRRPQIC